MIKIRDELGGTLTPKKSGFLGHKTPNFFGAEDAKLLKN